MDKIVRAKLNGGRALEGTLRGFDPFLNLVIEDCKEIREEKNVHLGCVVVRGGSIIMLEALKQLVEKN